MKKLILLIMCIPVLASAQDAVFDFDEVSYFGIDFSKVGILGANESDADFREVFERINTLVIGESDKFNLERTFGKTVYLEDLGTAIRRSVNQSSGMRTTNPNYTMTVEDMHAIVDAYWADGDTGYGLVIAAELLNKAAKHGTFIVVFFDRSNGDIVYYKRADGMANGFGLRNFWAGSIYNILRKWKY